MTKLDTKYEAFYKYGETGEVTRDGEKVIGLILIENPESIEFLGEVDGLDAVAVYNNELFRCVAEQVWINGHKWITGAALTPMRPGPSGSDRQLLFDVLCGGSGSETLEARKNMVESIKVRGLWR